MKRMADLYRIKPDLLDRVIKSTIASKPSHAPLILAAYWMTTCLIFVLQDRDRSQLYYCDLKLDIFLFAIISCLYCLKASTGLTVFHLCLLSNLIPFKLIDITINENQNHGITCRNSINYSRKQISWARGEMCDVTKCKCSLRLFRYRRKIILLGIIYDYPIDQPGVSDIVSGKTRANFTLLWKKLRCRIPQECCPGHKLLGLTHWCCQWTQGKMGKLLCPGSLFNWLKGAHRWLDTWYYQPDHPEPHRDDAVAGLGREV